MRFMKIVKSAEKSGPPPQKLMDAIAKLGAEPTKAGTLIETGRLSRARWVSACGSPRESSP